SSGRLWSPRIPRSSPASTSCGRMASNTSTSLPPRCWRTARRTGRRGPNACWTRRRPTRSVALARGAEPRQRSTQVVVGDVGEGRGDARLLGAVGCEQLRRRSPRQRRLPQPQVADRVPAEKPVDPLQDHARLVLDLQRGPAFDPPPQPAPLRPAAPPPPPPPHL